jgi:hypothetical protein
MANRARLRARAPADVSAVPNLPEAIFVDAMSPATFGRRRRISWSMVTLPCKCSGTPEQNRAPLDVIVEMEFVRMRAQPDGIDFAFALVVKPGLDHVSGEHIAAQKEGVIAFEGVKRLVQ